MDSNVISALISGFFSVVSAFGAVYLKEFLDARKHNQSVDEKHLHPPNVKATSLAKTQARSTKKVECIADLDGHVEIEPPEISSPAPAVPDATSAPAFTTESRSSKPLLMRPLLIVFGSFLFGLLTRALRPLFTGNTHWESLIALGVLLVLALYLALHHRKQGYALGFQLENVSIWTGWGAGWCLIHGSIWSDLLSVIVIWWFVCAVVGGVVSLVGKTRQRSSN